MLKSYLNAFHMKSVINMKDIIQVPKPPKNTLNFLKSHKSLISTKFKF